VVQSPASVSRVAILAVDEIRLVVVSPEEIGLNVDGAWIRERANIEARCGALAHLPDLIEPRAAMQVREPASGITGLSTRRNAMS
jgi:hypothetical protein